MNQTIDITTSLVTPSVALTLIPAFTAAYGLAASAMESFPFLNGELKRQKRPHLVNWAVEFELHRRSKEGIIPFDCAYSLNSRRNHRHAELRKDNFVLTISQTDSLLTMPKECVFRNSLCLDGQIALADFENGLGDSTKEVYAILTHGGGESAPSYILCGIPNPGLTAWVQHVELHALVRGLSVEDSSPITEEIKLDFRRSADKRYAATK